MPVGALLLMRFNDLWPNSAPLLVISLTAAPSRRLSTVGLGDVPPTGIGHAQSRDSFKHIPKAHTFNLTSEPHPLNGKSLTRRTSKFLSRFWSTIQSTAQLLSIWAKLRRQELQ